MIQVFIILTVYLFCRVYFTSFLTSVIVCSHVNKRSTEVKRLKLALVSPLFPDLTLIPSAVEHCPSFMWDTRPTTLISLPTANFTVFTFHYRLDITHTRALQSSDDITSFYVEKVSFIPVFLSFVYYVLIHDVDFLFRFS